MDLDKLSYEQLTWKCDLAQDAVADSPESEEDDSVCEELTSLATGGTQGLDAAAARGRHGEGGLLSVLFCSAARPVPCVNTAAIMDIWRSLDHHCVMHPGEYKLSLLNLSVTNSISTEVRYFR